MGAADFCVAVAGVGAGRVLGNSLGIQPSATNTSRPWGVFAMFSAEFMAGGREFHEQAVHDWRSRAIPKEPA